MFSIELGISNPFSDRWDILSNKAIQTGEHHFLELNSYKTSTIINLDFDIISGDHAGARLMVGLLGYEFEIHFYHTHHR